MLFDRLAGAVLRRLLLPRFTFFERLGIHVTPVHFYQAIPNVAAIDPDAYGRLRGTPGVAWRDEAQLAFATQVVEPLLSEYEPYANRMLCQMDAAIYYALVRHAKPRKIIEIGCGESTQLAALARARNAAEGHASEHIGIEPHPSAAVQALATNGLDLRAAPVQGLALETFDQCDLLFIDSTHVASFGSDVVREILEIVPSLPAGALVHWHDIFVPGEYPREWIERDHLFWNEHYLVQAFLAFNAEFEVLWSSAYMAAHHAEAMARTFGRLPPEDYPPSSLWVRRRTTDDSLNDTSIPRSPLRTS